MTSAENKNALDRIIFYQGRIIFIRGATLFHENFVPLLSTIILPTFYASHASVHFFTALSSPYYAGNFCGTRTIIHSLGKVLSAFFLHQRFKNINLGLLYSYLINLSRTFIRFSNHEHQTPFARHLPDNRKLFPYCLCNNKVLCSFHG